MKMKETCNMEEIDNMLDQFILNTIVKKTIKRFNCESNK